MASKELVVFDGRGTVKKASQVVMARGTGDLALSDLNLFNYLLQRSYKRLQDSPVHQIPVQDALDYLRLSGTGRLHESLERLGKVNIEIDYVDDENAAHRVGAHFLSFDVSRAENGILHYAFDPILLEFLKEPKVYALLSLPKARSFRSPYALKLYETMLMYYKRFSPVWEVTVDELREFFSVTDTHARFDNFRRKVIDAAVREVNDLAEFEVTVEYLKGGVGGKVVQLRFTASNKSHQRLMEAREVRNPIGKGRRTARDPNTVDLLDGRTDAERGAPAELLAETLDLARSLAGTLDVAEFEERWREEMRGRIVRDPDASFINWLKLTLERSQDAMLADLEDDTFGTLLEQVNRA
jgi:hypothetical protein